MSRTDRLSFARIAKLGFGGAVGGMLTFVVSCAVLRGNALVGSGDASGGWGGTLVRGYLVAGIVLGAIVGLTIGAGLIGAEECHTRNAARILRRSLTGAAAGALCGALGGLDGQFTFTVFHYINGTIARCIGWALMGAGAGICPGYVSKSMKRAEQGAFGGLVGGFLGGMLFDVMALATGGADVGRAIAFVLVGAAIGIAVGLVEEIAKQYWLTILTGSKEGQSFVISKPITTVGRDETIDIPLFGDMTVQKLHARIGKSNAGARISVVNPASPVEINSQSTTDTRLNDGDIIAIGKHRLRFSSRGGEQVDVPQQPPEQPRPASATVLWVNSGPHAGLAYPLHSASVMIGRSPECDIALVNDGQVSRQHARMVWNGACWRIEDCGSTNGVFVNGHKVATLIVNSDDEIVVGQTAMRVS